MRRPVDSMKVAARCGVVLILGRAYDGFVRNFNGRGLRSLGFLRFLALAFFRLAEDEPGNGQSIVAIANLGQILAKERAAGIEIVRSPPRALPPEMSYIFFYIEHP